MDETVVAFHGTGDSMETLRHLVVIGEIDYL
jgi:alpha-beta hydrolase superfamily lysophospholipase